MNKILLLISCLSFLFSEQKILWDLGVTIKNEKNENAILKPLISNTQIAPTYTTAINNKQLLDLSITSL